MTAETRTSATQQTTAPVQQTASTTRRKAPAPESDILTSESNSASNRPGQRNDRSGYRPATPRRRQALVDRLDALDHRGVFRAVFVPDRFDGILERLLVDVGDDFGAGRLHLLDRGVLRFIPEHTLLGLGFLRQFLD